MPETSLQPYTHAHRLLDGGSVAFECSQDADFWPWLALHPFDPIVVQTVNYWASVECGAARGTFDPNKWSALVQTEWTCGAEGAGHAARGISEVIGDADNPRFQMTFFDADGALVYKMGGKGVVFHNRDFEGWRAKAKAELAARVPVADFEYAPHETTGMRAQWQSFLSPLVEGETVSAHALITKENGLPPAHPYLSGSGDHVNATHLADIGRQFAQAVRGGQPRSIIGGEMSFKHYVELGRPFDIALAKEGMAEGGSSDEAVSMNVSQAGRFCAAITLKMR